MFRPSAFAATTLVALLSGTAVSALTADEVWSAWKEGGTAAGLTVSAATESNSGGVLTLNGVTIVPPDAPSGLSISDLTMTENDDGSVTITPGAAIGVDVTEGANSFKLNLVHDGLELVASEGEAGGIVYDFAATSAEIVFDTASEGYSFTDAPAQPVVNSGKVGFSELTGGYADTPGANRTFSLSLAAATLYYDTLSEDPNLPMKSTSVSETDGITLDLEFVLPTTTKLAEIETAAQFGTALQEGLSLAVSFTNGASTGAATAEDEFMPFDMKLTSLAGESAFAFDKDSFSAAASAGGLTIDVTSAAMPVPVQVSSGPMNMELLSPIMSGDAASDYKLVFSLEQFALSDTIWGMFDPASTLPREPFDLLIDLSGLAQVDWVALAVADETGAPPPVPQPQSLDIAQIALSAAGATAEGVGSFTFDNSLGMPMPLGSADVVVTGASQLIDGLISIGLLTEEDAMGARFMMGAFMVPGAEPDSLTSKIEAKEGFAIFVNGQQIQ